MPAWIGEKYFVFVHNWEIPLFSKCLTDTNNESYAVHNAFLNSSNESQVIIDNRIKYEQKIKDKYMSYIYSIFSFGAVQPNLIIIIEFGVNTDASDIFRSRLMTSHLQSEGF